ncbi:MAG: class I SAM-dependent methyltransferase [Magnetococcales bacterium]|nr:class I SAM-dependent methyltransferase [Magnetococcales bacterium]
MFLASRSSFTGVVSHTDSPSSLSGGESADAIPVPWSSYPGVAVLATEPSLLLAAEQLAQSLGLPLAGPGGKGYPLLLVRTPERLELRVVEARGEGPIHVHFAAEDRPGRLRGGRGGHRQLIAAMGSHRRSFSPRVLDATAGLGRDGFILACSGYRVTMVERSPIVAALLADGLERARGDARIAPVVTANLTLLHADALQVMSTTTADARPEVVYLDPMHPPRVKSALVRKEMRRLRAIVGDDADARLLFAAALDHARERVVVKRPRQAESITARAPSYVLTGRSTRYDIYLTGATPAAAAREADHGLAE